MLIFFIVGVVNAVAFFVLVFKQPERFTLLKGLLLITATVFLLASGFAGFGQYYSENLKGKVITIEFK